MSTINFTPAPGTVCIELIKEATTSGGIITSVNEDRRYPARGVILAVDKSIDFVAVGDLVLYDMAIMEDLEVGGKSFDLVLEQNILGKFN